MHTANNNLFQRLLASINKLQADSIIWWRKIEMQLSWEYTIEHNYVIKQVFTFHLGLANLLVVCVITGSLIKTEINTNWREHPWTKMMQ